MKAVLDGDGFIIGVGETEQTAKADAVKSILDDGAATREAIISYVEDLSIVGMTEALRIEVERQGGIARYRRLPSGVIGTLDEASKG
jgi:hypothetical protein